MPITCQTIKRFRFCVSLLVGMLSLKMQYHTGVSSKIKQSQLAAHHQIILTRPVHRPKASTLRAHFCSRPSAHSTVQKMQTNRAGHNAPPKNAQQILGSTGLDGKKCTLPSLLSLLSKEENQSEEKKKVWQQSGQEIVKK